jgi:hypothetical protein
MCVLVAPYKLCPLGEEQQNQTECQMGRGVVDNCCTQRLSLNVFNRLALTGPTGMTAESHCLHYICTVGTPCCGIAQRNDMKR